MAVEDEGPVAIQTHLPSSAKTPDPFAFARSSTLNRTIQARDHSKANEVSTINSSSTDVSNDLAGNLTKMPRLVGNDVVGHYVCVFDPWNRLIKLQSDDTTPIVYATMAYDGRGRRISKAVTNSGDLDCTYHYYLDGDSMIEVRNGSDQVLKEQVWRMSKGSGVVIDIYWPWLVLREGATCFAATIARQSAAPSPLRPTGIPA